MEKDFRPISIVLKKIYLSITKVKKYFDRASKKLQNDKYSLLQDSIKMKEASITFKTKPQVKKALEKLAEEGFRSLSGQVEMIIVKYLEDNGINWREEATQKENEK